MLSKLSKLRRMSFAEILQRTLQKYHTYQERRCWRSRQKPTYDGYLDQSQFVEKSAILFAGLDEKPPMKECEIGFETYSLLSHPFDLNAALDWHSDSKSGYSWPQTFYSDLHLHCLDDHVDFKYPWELSRHQYFVDMLLAPEHLNGPTRVFEIWEDWIDRNPIYQGINWTSGLEAAMRIVSWTSTISIAKNCAPQLLEEYRQKILSSLIDHAVYLNKHFSYYSSPYNHLVGEATALFILGVILAEHKSAASWREHGLKTLVQTIDSQFYKDGFSVEQAVSYHYYTLGFLVLAIVTGRRFGYNVQPIEEVVHKAFQAGVPFRMPDGRWPCIGDLDSARTLPSSGRTPWNFDGLCHCAAVLFDDPQLANLGHEPGTELEILFTASEREKWHELRSRGQPSSQCRILEDSGYAIASDGADWVLFDAGPVAGGLFSDNTPSTAHGHADTLQVLYACDGKAILEDSGIPFYNGKRNWIEHFRSPAAHNTVDIEGVELVRSEGKMSWSREVKRPTLLADCNAERWLCSGTVRWPGVSHKRLILGLPKIGIWIADLIRSSSIRKATWYWQMPHVSEISFEESDLGMLAKLDTLQMERWSCTNIPHTTLESSVESSPRAKYCPEYGDIRCSNLISWESTIATELLVLTYFGRHDRPAVNVSIGEKHVGTYSDNSECGHAWVFDGCSWRVGASTHTNTTGDR